MSDVAPIVLALCRRHSLYYWRCVAPCAYRRSGACFPPFAAPISFFRGFLFICRTSPISGERIAVQLVLAQRKGHERIGEARTSMRRASPIVKEICSMRYDDEVKASQKNAQRHSPRPIPNDWRYFRPTLVFAGHYL
jgi:hypothetical protein